MEGALDLCSSFCSAAQRLCDLKSGRHIHEDLTPTQKYHLVLGCSMPSKKYFIISNSYQISIFNNECLYGSIIDVIDVILLPVLSLCLRCLFL